MQNITKYSTFIAKPTPMKTHVLLTCILLLCIGCHKVRKHSAVADIIADTTANSNDTIVYESKEDSISYKDTYLRFPEFDLILHKFYGYYVNSEDNTLVGDYGVDLVKDSLTDTELLVARRDTVKLSEDLDERLNKTLLQLVPKNKDDRFKLSMAYVGHLWEYYDSILYAGDMERYEKVYHNVRETTKYVKLTDSAQLYFRATPHTADMVPVVVKNGKMVMERSTTDAEMKAEEQYYTKELDKIKRKYKLRDTLVEYPGEYTYYGNLTGNKRIYGYEYESYIIKIERYRKKKLIETKYVVVSIMYGC